MYIKYMCHPRCTCKAQTHDQCIPVPHVSGCKFGGAPRDKVRDPSLHTCNRLRMATVSWSLIFCIFFPHFSLISHPVACSWGLFASQCCRFVPILVSTTSRTIIYHIHIYIYLTNNYEIFLYNFKL